MIEFYKCLGIALVVLAAIVIVVVTGLFLSVYAETLAGLIALLVLLTLLVYVIRN